MEQLKARQMKTALFERHQALGAKIVDFCGWEMPLQYQGIIPEHLSVRKNGGIFDVSHMGRVEIVGPDAEKFLDYLSTNKIMGKSDFSATYTVWPNAQGGCVDDVIVYKQAPNHFVVIVNAGNRQTDLEHLKQTSGNFDVNIIDHYSNEGILAIQGPNVRKIVSKTFPEAMLLKHMHFTLIPFKGKELYLSATGYTGEDGFEIYAPENIITFLWDLWTSQGVTPVGLGARDTLRLEMGYALYGHEISETIAPNESVSAWTIKWDKPDFLGKKNLEELQKSPSKRTEYGIELMEPGIARAGYEVFKNGILIGEVTSGTHSPSLNKAIAIILVKGQLSIGDAVEVKIRQHQCKAKVVKLPFKQEEK